MYRTQADYDNVILNPDPSRVLKDEHFNTPTILMDWDYADYNYQWIKLTDRNVFTQPTTGGGAYAIAGPSDGYRDQIVRARMRATQFNGADRWFGLIGRYVDSQNYYYVTLRSSNQISLRKLTNGVATTLDTASLSATTPVAVNTWYDLRLDIVGTKLRVYLNGLLMLEATDTASPHVSGRYGVGAYKTAAEADDFLAIQP
jgi:pectate lyase